MKHFTFILFLFLKFGFCQAQNPISQISVSSEYVELSSQQIAQMTTEQLEASPKIFEVKVTLTSATDVEKVVLMIGSAEGSNDVFYKEFDYGVSGDFQDGTSYSSNGNVIVLGTPIYGENKHFIQVMAVKEDGRQDAPVRTTIN